MLELTPYNSRRPGSKEAEAWPYDMELLEKIAYEVYSVRKLTVLYADPHVHYPDRPLYAQVVGPKGHDLVISGTYRQLLPGRSGVVAVGPVMRAGHMDTEGLPIARFRGGVAVLKDGTIVVGRADGANAKEIQSSFGQKGNPVVDFVGGGALLVEDGKRVSDRDLLLEQTFRGDPGGIRAVQMEVDVHSLVGIRNGQCFVMAASGRDASQIRNDMLDMKFGAVVKFERGSGFYLNDGENRFMGTNEVGFGVKLHRGGEVAPP